MPFERSVPRSPLGDNVLFNDRRTTPSPIESVEVLNEYEWGMVRRLPLLEHDRRELKRKAAEHFERFQQAARAYQVHHPEARSIDGSIEAWARAELQQPAGYRRLVEEVLTKVGELLSRDIMLLARMREEARQWLMLQQRIRRIESTIQTITPFAKRVGRA